MVSTDSKAYLLNYVRSCFSSGDDSGFCEQLLNGVESVTDEEIQSILKGEYTDQVIDTDADNFHRYSPECPYISCEDPLLLFGASIVDREDSSNVFTSSQQKNRSETRQLSAEEVDKYFPSKPITRDNKPDTLCKSEKSGLTLALEQAKLSGHLRRNKIFSDFAVYDARSTLSTNQRVSSDRLLKVDSDSSLRQFNVWLWRLNGFPRTSIKVQPRLGTTVQQFIGLTLWQYFNEFSTGDGDTAHLPTQLDNLDGSFLDRLALYMLDAPDADEEDVESEFPPLELNDPIHKYQFESYAVVERVETSVQEALQKTEIPRVLVTIHMAQGMSVLRFPSDTCLSAVLERAVYRRRLRQHGGYAYRLELWPRSTDQQTNGSKGGAICLPNTTAQAANKNSQLDLSQPLSYFISIGLPLHFLLVRESSRCDPALSDQSDDIETVDQTESVLVLDSSEPVHTALQLRQYQVTYLKGLFPREVQLNVSASEIKLEQGNASRRPKLFSKTMKPITIQINAIAECELISSGFPTSGTDKPHTGHCESHSGNHPVNSTATTFGASGGGTLTDAACLDSSPLGVQKNSTKGITEQQSSKSLVSRKAQFRIVYIPNFESHSDAITSHLAITSGTAQKSVLSTLVETATTVGSRTTVSQPLIPPFSSAYPATVSPGQDIPVCISNNTTGICGTITTTNTTTTAVLANSSSLFQQLCFETQWARARAICDQLNVILEVSQSQARHLYIQRKLTA
ncbi:unnamed protein product [Heterobilharzia americana]|nr:unnamed protein product [Heterobilharzia americana]